MHGQATRPPGRWQICVQDQRATPGASGRSRRQVAIRRTAVQAQIGWTSVDRHLCPVCEAALPDSGTAPPRRCGSLASRPGSSARSQPSTRKTSKSGSFAHACSGHEHSPDGPHLILQPPCSSRARAGGARWFAPAGPMGRSAACQRGVHRRRGSGRPADVILVNARVYTRDWRGPPSQIPGSDPGRVRVPAMAFHPMMRA